jgi:hypothetical protein
MASATTTPLRLPLTVGRVGRRDVRRRPATRYQAAGDDSSTPTAAKVRIFKGGNAEVLFGAKQNMYGCLERADDAGIEAAIEELSGMSPTEAPAKSPLLLGKWRLVWSKQAESANYFQKAFGKAAKRNFQIVGAAGSLENLVQLGPLTVSGKGGRGEGRGGRGGGLLQYSTIVRLLCANTGEAN